MNTYICFLETTQQQLCVFVQAQSSNLSTAGASWEEKKKRLWQRPSPRRSVGTLPSQASASRLGTSTQPTRLRQMTLTRDGCSTPSATDSVQSKQKSNAGENCFCATAFNIIHALVLFRGGEKWWRRLRIHVCINSVAVTAES